MFRASFVRSLAEDRLSPALATMVNRAHAIVDVNLPQILSAVRRPERATAQELAKLHIITHSRFSAATVLRA
jgi:hypothetical protein